MGSAGQACPEPAEMLIRFIVLSPSPEKQNYLHQQIFSGNVLASKEIRAIELFLRFHH
jgi:hypothetical protein